MLTPDKTRALGQIRSDINSKYGFKGGMPRVNMGPCGAFAKAFYEIWNELFTSKVTICFLFDEKIPPECRHCFIKLPDGNYFDGGNGIFSSIQLFREIPGNWCVEEMCEYDYAELDRNSNGLIRTYCECSNYDYEYTAEIIRAHLSGK